ncbi:MAG: peptidoglycan-binding protein, partial [Arenicellales bacterium]
MVSVAVALWLGGTEVRAQQNNPLQRFSDTAKEFWDQSKARGKTDSFNIRIAFKSAVQKEETGAPFRWNNTHTKNKGEIVLVNYSKPLGNCVNYKHTYYARGYSANVDRGTVCKNSQGIWNDIAIPAVFQSAGSTNQYSERQLQERETVREVQGLLHRLEYDPGPIDGRQGAKTRRAIEQYQRDVDLPVSGQISTELVTALKQSVSATTQPQPGSIQEVSNTETADASSAVDTAQPVISVLPDIEEVSKTETADASSSVDTAQPVTSVLPDIEEVSNTETADASSSVDAAQPVTSVLPDIEAVEIASDTKDTSEPASVISRETDEVDVQGFDANEKPDRLAVNQGAVPPIEVSTPVITADKSLTDSGNYQVKTGPTNSTRLPKTIPSGTGVSVFPWFYAILGFVFFGTVALFFSRFVAPKRDRPSAIRGRSDPVRDTAQGPISEEPALDSSQTLASSRNNRLFDGQLEERTQFQREVNEHADNVTLPQPVPGPVTEDHGDTILIAITEFDDIIKETERVLSQTVIDRGTRSY